jgi:hypothetical protein
MLGWLLYNYTIPYYCRPLAALSMKKMKIQYGDKFRFFKVWFWFSGSDFLVLVFALLLGLRPDLMV